MRTSEITASNLGNVKTHSGANIDETMDLYGAAPAEVGELLSAGSTLRHGKRPIPLAMRLLLGFGGAGVLFVALWFAAAGFADSSNVVDQRIANLIRFAGGAMAVAWVALLFYFTRFRHECSYVGERGFCVHKMTGALENIASHTVLFAEVAGVKKRLVKRYINGIYTGTAYQYDWLDTGGRLLLRLKGTAYAPKDQPKPHDPLNLAIAAEAAWTQYQRKQWDDLMRTQGYLQFVVDKDQWIRIYPSAVELCLSRRSEPLTIAKEDIAGFETGIGMLMLKLKNEQKYRGRGSTMFRLEDLHNSEAFHMALEHYILDYEEQAG